MNSRSVCYKERVSCWEHCYLQQADKSQQECQAPTDGFNSGHLSLSHSLNDPLCPSVSVSLTLTLCISPRCKRRREVSGFTFPEVVMNHNHFKALFSSRGKRLNVIFKALTNSLLAVYPHLCACISLRSASSSM